MPAKSPAPFSMSERSPGGRIIGGPVGFARLLERLGPVFLEFGRFLAVRPDFLPPEFRDELLESEESGKPLPWAAVQAILAEELKDPESIFESIDPVSLSYGPLNQLHRAVTRDGRRVWIKVLRPETLRRPLWNRRRVDLFARLLGWSGAGLLSARRELLAEWKLWYEAELDLSKELACLRLLAEAAVKDSGLRVPRPYPELSTRRVLTLEDLGGIPLPDVLVPARRAGQSLENYDFDPRQLAANLLETTVQQMFGRHFFNAAVHPGSLLVLPGNRFTFLSFAHCESVDPATGRLQVRFLSGVFRTDLAAIFRTLEELLDPGVSADIEGMRTDFILESNQWLRGELTASPRRGTRTHGSPMSNWMLALIRSARRNRFRLSREMLAVYRTLISVEWIANRLDSGVQLQSAGLQFLADIQLDEALRILEPQVQYNAVSDLLTAMSAAPEHLRRILSDSVAGRLAVNLNVTEQGQSGRVRDRRSNMIAAAIAAVGIAWLIGEREIPGIASLFPVTILAPILAILYFYILVQWRRLGR
jgi:ubiquinone biosynthesis protein